MKYFILTALAAVLFIPGAALGELTIDRVWTSSTGNYGYALVTYVNTSGKTFERAVTIQCVAYDTSGRKINMNKRSFFAREHGAMGPGFEGTIKVPVQIDGIPMKEMSCKALER